MNVFRGLYGTCFETTCVRVCKLKAGVVFETVSCCEYHSSLELAHSYTSVQAQGWSGIRNSELLRRAEAHFDLLITADQNIVYQQNLSGRTIAVLELSTNDLRRIQASAILIQNAINVIRPAEFVKLEILAF